jgi:6-phosphogluconolactonase
MTSRIVYVSCADPREIAVLRLDPQTGALDPVAVVSVPGLDAASPTMPLAVSPDRRFLYAGLRLPPYPVCSFAIDPVSGGLRLLGTVHLPDSMAYLATDRTGRMLLGASYGGAVVSAGPIDAAGVAGAAVQVLPTPPKAHCILPDPRNRFVYAACLGGDAVLCWPLGAGGLEAGDAPMTTALRPGAGPRHMAFGRDGAILYVLNELDGTVDVFARDTVTGALAHRQTIAAYAGSTGSSASAEAADIHPTPDGRFLYASIRVDSTIAAFAVSATDGSLSFAGRYEVEATPRGFAIDPDGRFLLSAGRTSASLGVYAIDTATGALARVAVHAVGENPNWVEILDLG